MIELQATCQTLKTCCHDMLVSDSLNAIKMRFVFSDEWDGMVKTAQFTQKKNNTSKYVTYNVLLDEDETAMLPNEIESGVVLVSVFGVNSIERMTTNTVAFPIMKSGFVGDGQTPIPPTPDLYQQLVMKVLNTAGSPVIGENGNWYLDNIDTGIKADWSAEQANAAASAAAAAQSAKDAAETLNSIPEDYAELAAEVSWLSTGSGYPIRRELVFSYGGSNTNGTIYGDGTIHTAANRYISQLVNLRKGDRISIADGYAFGFNLYEHYNSNDDFELVIRRGMDTESAVIPQNGQAFIFIKKTDDSAFTTDEVLTMKNHINLNGEMIPAGEALNLFPEMGAMREVYTIPVDALAYHELWASEIPVDKYTYTQELLTYADDTEKYPIYLYKFDRYNNWIDSDYLYNNYNDEKENRLYRKPRILVISGIHGNEKATPVAVISFVKNLLENPEYSHLIGQFDWYFIPLLNPWGFSHSLVNSAGVCYDNTAKWLGFAPEGYTLMENTTTTNGGTRRTASGLDINRDFSDVTYTAEGFTYGFQTVEAQAVLAAAEKYRFDMMFDLHQSFDASAADKAPKCGYVRMFYGARATPSPERLNFYRIASGVNAKVDNYCRARFGAGAVKPMSLVWHGGTNPSILNYFGGVENEGLGNTAHKDLACTYAFCAETSQICYPISLLADRWYNDIATSYTNRYCAELIKALSELAN